jgi:hypothetical protein
MSLLAFARLNKALHAPARAKSRDRACGEPTPNIGKFHSAGLHALDFPEISIIRRESGRDNEET